jgi:hypothetical protein
MGDSREKEFSVGDSHGRFIVGKDLIVWLKVIVFS